MRDEVAPDSVRHVVLDGGRAALLQRVLGTPPREVEANVKRQNLVLRMAVALVGTVPIVATATVDASADAVWQYRAPMLAARFAGAAATGTDGTVFVVGGTTVAHDWVASNEAYDPSSDSWAVRSPMPTARSYPAAVTGADGQIYVIGGYANNSLATVEAYNPATDTWTARASLLHPRYVAAAATAQDGKIYVFGGANDSVSNLISVEAYDPSTNTWTERAPMPTGRYALGATVGPDGLVYVIGGCCDAANLDMNVVEAYNPITDTWVTKPPVPYKPLTPLVATGADGKIYSISGYDDKPGWMKDVYIFDTATQTWSAGPPVQSARETGMIAVSGGAIYAIGGEGPGPLSSMEALLTTPPVTPTSISISATPSAPRVGQTVIYAATVTPAPTGGTVTFTDNGSTITSCTNIAVNTTTGSASCSVTYAHAGAHAISAAFSGNQGFATSQSQPLNVLVAPAATTLTARNVSVTFALLAPGATFSARLVSDVGGAALSGVVVSFTDRSGGPLCSTTTDTQGRATCSASAAATLGALAQGSYTASFAGTPDYLPAQASAAVTL